eukprot:gene9756-7631_t
MLHSETFPQRARARYGDRRLLLHRKLLPARPRPTARPNASSSSVNGILLKYPTERDFNLNEYMVVLEKPLGMTLAPDPISGKIMVQNIEEGSPAAACQLMQVGDIVKMCSAVFGEDMWQAIDIRRIRWAINNRTSKVKLVKLVLERSRRSNMLPTWYSKGQSGRCSVERDTLQLPVSFTSLSIIDDWTQDMVPSGKPLFVGFHRSVMGISQKHSLVVRKRDATLEELRQELVSARSEPEMDLMGTPSSSYTSSSSSSSSTSTPSSSSSPSKARERDRIPDRPRELDTRDLTHVASCRGLGAVLELGLVSMGGHVALRGTDPALFYGENSTSAPAASSSTSSPSPPSSSKSPPSSSTSSSTSSTSNSAPTSSYSPTSAAGTPSPSSSSYPYKSSNFSIATTSPAAVKAVSGRLGKRQGGNARSRRYSNFHIGRIRTLINAAAALQRLSFRRKGSVHHALPEACALLIHCKEDVEEAQVASLLAGWLHWYRRMPLQEALLSAELAMGCQVEQNLLEDATEYMVELGEEKLNRVVVAWKYGGMSVAVAGDIVGGWQNKVSLERCKKALGCRGDTARGHHFLELAGLGPGTYYYKFIVDGMWTVDPTAPKVLDTSGNYNNVLKVYEQQPIITSKERMDMARWKAAHLALELPMDSLPKKWLYPILVPCSFASVPIGLVGAVRKVIETDMRAVAQIPQWPDMYSQCVEARAVPWSDWQP